MTLTTQDAIQPDALQLLVDCCSPVTGQVMDATQAEALAGVLKAIAEPTRLRLLSLVAAHAGNEACVCDLTDPVGLSQPTVSHHLKVLVDAGLLGREQRGRWAYYRLIPDALQTLAQLLAATTNSAR
ncbi:MAG: metalloregulator ArsR/SmtB family transcription factor [Actinomycetota bacterium]|nr:metalloregulator ArsR/SmtB family transcription factor [Actinomycetota bacterium]